MVPSPLTAVQRAFFQSGATRSLGFRREQLRILMDALERHDDELLEALHADLHKNPHEAHASETGFVLGEIRHALRRLSSWVKPARRRSPLLAWPARSLVMPEPYGIALIIGPWNYPVQLLLSPLVGAIAAGNCAILKPSEFAPHTADVLGRIVRATFPEEYIAVVQGDRGVSEALLRERFDTIFFTGSSQTGRAVMEAAARHLTPVTLELGGKCPCIVSADAPLETTARRIVWGKFMNAGQTCVAPDHVWVDRRIAPDLVRCLKEVLRGFYGDSHGRDSGYGRIVNRRHLDRLVAYLGDGVIAHGGQSNYADLFIEPTLLLNPDWDSPVMTEEIFGPILPVLEFTELDEVLEKIRSRPKPLALYLFTGDRPTQERVLAGTQSGGVCINDTVLQILGHELPFGGVGESGMGSYHGKAGFDCFSHRRTVLRRSLAVDPSFRYPPPRVSLATLKRLLRFTG